MFEIKGACLYSCVSYGKDRFVKLRNVHFIVKHRLLWTHCLETAVYLLPWKRILRACRCKEKTFYDVNYNSCTMRAPLIVRRDIHYAESSFSGEVSSQCNNVVLVSHATLFLSFETYFRWELCLVSISLEKNNPRLEKCNNPVKPPFKLNSRQATSEVLSPLVCFWRFSHCNKGSKDYE